MRLAYWTGMRRSERSTKTMKATTAIMPATSDDDGDGGKCSPGAVAGLLVEIFDALGQADDDAGEDEQAHTVADTALGDLLAEPHDEGGAGGEGDDAERDEGAARMVTIDWPVLVLVSVSAMAKDCTMPSRTVT